MNELQVFNFNDTNITTLTIDKNVWFVGKEVAEVLGYKNMADALRTKVDDEDLKTLSYKDYRETRQALSVLWSGNDYSNKTIINESGMYSLVLGSKLPSAKAFKRWVTSEVLPSIRKHGAYMTDQTIEQVLSDPDTIIKIATDLKNERQRTAMLSQRINELEPKASYYDKILQNKSLINISVIAKDYGMSAVSMNKLLHELGVQYKQGNMWLLYAQHQKKGWTKSNTTMVTKADGTEKTVMNTKWTQKGCLGIYEILKINGYLPVIEQDDIEQPA